MIINKIAVGNAEEAYIENFRDSLNIISSDDNENNYDSIFDVLGNVPAFE